MKSENRAPYIFGVILSLMVVGIMAFVGVSLFQIKEPGYNFIETKEESFGWNYEIQDTAGSREVTPKFLDEYTADFGAQEAFAIRMTRTMNESMEYPSLQFYPYGTGVEVFLDDMLLYSDYQTSHRDADGYLILSEEERNKPQFTEVTARKINVTMPEDYMGKALTVITYFQDQSEGIHPAYPLLENDTSDSAPIAMEQIVPVASMVICGILILMLCGILLFSIRKNQVDYRIICLILYFLLCLIDRAVNSLSGDYSGMNTSILMICSGLYVTPMVIYVALHLTRWRKYLLLVCAGIQFLYEGGRHFLKWKNGEPFLIGMNGKTVAAILLLLLLLSALEFLPYRKNWQRLCRWRYIGLLAGAVVFSIGYYAIDTEGNIGWLFRNIAASVRDGHFVPLNHLVFTIMASVIVVLLVTHLAESTVRMYHTISMLSAKEKHAMQELQLLQNTEKATKELRHELRHHLVVLDRYLKNQEEEKGSAYIEEILQELGEQTEEFYCSNIIANTLINHYFRQAKDMGVTVIYNISIPETMAISDTDFCSLLSNMLENAVEACKRMPADSERAIHLMMKFSKNFLFIKCENSTDRIKAEGEGEGLVFLSAKEDKENHGYGMAAMKKVAAKYNSIIITDILPASFIVKTNLFLDQKSKQRMN